MGAASVDLCYTAMGRLDAYYEGYLKPWDIAAGLLIAREAGAKIGWYVDRNNSLPSDLDGSGTLVAASSIFEDLLRLLNRVT